MGESTSTEEHIGSEGTFTYKKAPARSFSNDVYCVVSEVLALEPEPCPNVSDDAYVEDASRVDTASGNVLALTTC